MDDDDRRFFLQCLAEACEKTGWRVRAWVSMANRYHLFMETPKANLVEGMKWLQNTLTRRFNVRHRQWGRLFGDRYKSSRKNIRKATTGWFNPDAGANTLTRAAQLHVAMVRVRFGYPRLTFYKTKGAYVDLLAQLQPLHRQIALSCA